jgi:hypothetical protein
MKHNNRPFLFVLFLILMLGYRASTSQPMRTGFSSSLGCAEQCKERYDAMVKRCNELSGSASERCQTVAQKQYDNCLERCKGGD